MKRRGGKCPKCSGPTRANKGLCRKCKPNRCCICCRRVGKGGVCATCSQVVHDLAAIHNDEVPHDPTPRLLTRVFSMRPLEGGRR